MAGNMNNNNMGQFNGGVRDREKVMRSLKIKKTPILTGYQIYYNYIREHQGTPLLILSNSLLIFSGSLSKLLATAELLD
jgi:hypothetical protein